MRVGSSGWLLSVNFHVVLVTGEISGGIEDWRVIKAVAEREQI